MMKDRYRWRTRLRRRMPWFMLDLGIAKKGKGDCLAHDWYKASEQEDRCYHCQVGIRRPSQFLRSRHRARLSGGRPCPTGLDERWIG